MHFQPGGAVSGLMKRWQTSLVVSLGPMVCEVTRWRSPAAVMLRLLLVAHDMCATVHCRDRHPAFVGLLRRAATEEPSPMGGWVVYVSCVILVSSAASLFSLSRPRNSIFFLVAHDMCVTVHCGDRYPAFVATEEPSLWSGEWPAPFV